MVGSQGSELGTGYKSPKHAQVWFLNRSRRRWKKKYQELKVVEKRWKNRVADVSKSRESWQAQAEVAASRVRELEAENLELRERLSQKKRN